MPIDDGEVPRRPYHVRKILSTMEYGALDLSVARLAVSDDRLCGTGLLLEQVTICNYNTVANRVPL